MEQVVVAARKAGPRVRWIHGACFLGGGRDGRRVDGETEGFKRKPSFCVGKRGVWFECKFAKSECVTVK